MSTLEHIKSASRIGPSHVDPEIEVQRLRGVAPIPQGLAREDLSYQLGEFLARRWRATFVDRVVAAERQTQTGMAERGHALRSATEERAAGPDRAEHLLPFVYVPRAAPQTVTRFITLQKYEGTVLRIEGDGFVARIVDPATVDEDFDAEFALEEVTPSDRHLLIPGAVFYWNLGYLDRPEGRVRASDLRMRRLPTWSQDELDAARKRAEALAANLDW